MTSITWKAKPCLLRWGLIALFWLLLWQIGAWRLNQPLLLPSPLQVGRRLGELAVTLPFWQSIAFSLRRIVAGFLLGFFSAALLAVAGYFLPPLASLLAPPLAIIKSTPVASFIVLALLWLPSPWLSAFIAFLMVLPLCYENLLAGLKSADPLLLEMGKVYAFTPFQVFRYIYLPALVPYALAAVRTGLGFAWKAGIAGEVLAIPTGAMGTQLHTAKVTLETTDLFAWTAAIILLSLALEKGAVALVKCLSRRYTPPKKEDMSC